MTRAAVATVTIAALLIPQTRAEAVDAAFRDWQQAHRRPRICARFRPGPAEAQRVFPADFREQEVKRAGCLKNWHRKQRREFRAEQARLRVNAAPPQPFAGGDAFQPAGFYESLICDVFGPTCAAAVSVARCETAGFTDFTNESSGAAGLFQFMPFHWEGTWDPYDPWVNAQHAYTLSHGGTDWSAWSCRP